MWNHLPWNHVTGSRDKSVSSILSGLIWGLWSRLPCSCCEIWTRSHVVQVLQLISFLFSVDGLSGRTQFSLQQLWNETPNLFPFEFLRPYFHIALLPLEGNVASAPFCLLSEPESFRVLVRRVAWGPFPLPKAAYLCSYHTIASSSVFGQRRKCGDPDGKWLWYRVQAREELILLPFVRVWKRDVDLRWDRYFVFLICRCSWVRAVKDLGNLVEFVWTSCLLLTKPGANLSL